MTGPPALDQVVDERLRVFRIGHLKVADASVVPLHHRKHWIAGVCCCGEGGGSDQRRSSGVERKTACDTDMIITLTT